MVKVLEITLQLIVERTVTKAVEYFFSLFDWLIAQNNLFDFFIGLDEDINIKGIDLLVVRKQALELKQANLLDRLWRI